MPTTTPHTSPTIVNSWNEWDPLQHIIVGRAQGTMVQAPEPAVCRSWPEHGFPKGSFGLLPPDMQERADEQLDAFAAMLARRGVRVDRPEPLDFSQAISTPDWQQASMFGCMPPRDLLLTLGNEILEAPMSYRSRWFEYLCYRPLLERYFREDARFRWESGPKPRLTERSYKPGYNEWYEQASAEERSRIPYEQNYILTEEEPLFDAADLCRMGKDVMVQLSVTTNRAGLDWLRRHFPETRFHEATFLESHPMHIDATFVPLRPGLALLNKIRPILNESMKRFFAINDWEVVECAEPFQSGPGKLSFCSQWLSMNTLSLDAKTICVNADETAQMEQFDKLGFDVIPVPFTAVAPFGGGLHCATADVRRDGALQEYFPRQVPGY